jgi:hypothetical protein
VPARYRRPAPPVRRGRRRQLIWTETNVGFTTAAGASNNVDLTASLEAAGTSHLGVTVMRTIIRVSVQNWAAVVDDILFGCVVGRAADVGTTPALASMPGLDWWFRTELQPTTQGATVNVAEFYDYDLRSKRKCGEQDQRALACFTNQAATSKNIQMFARVLWALP